MTMSYQVGTKGQVVVAKEIRDKLGVKPGWKAYQRLVDDRVEIRFLPPEHTRSLMGILAPRVKRSIPPGEPWRLAKEQAWAAIARERVKRWKKS